MTNGEGDAVDQLSKVQVDAQHDGAPAGLTFGADLPVRGTMGSPIGGGFAQGGQQPLPDPTSNEAMSGAAPMEGSSSRR